jgi:hypothetical protein
MSRAALKTSLALWHRRVAYRKRRLAVAQKAGHADGRLTGAEVKRIDKWKGLLSKAQATVVRREKQIVAKAPLRERAWNQMQVLVDEKVVEVGGNNRGKVVEQIIRANGGTPGEPWCGDTVAYCYLKAGAKSVVRAWASVAQLERLLALVRFPSLGHVVTYTFDHTGLFDRWLTTAEIKTHGLTGTGWFYAGEGNTGDAGAVSDSVTGHDGVKLKIRNKSQVASFRRVLR